jgi:hypothetical protein
VAQNLLIRLRGVLGTLALEQGDELEQIPRRTRRVGRITRRLLRTVRVLGARVGVSSHHTRGRILRRVAVRPGSSRTTASCAFHTRARTWTRESSFILLTLR